MIKLIATDMDGTLLKSNNEIQDGFYDVFHKLKEKDIIFAAASGRQYYNLLERFKGLDNNMMFIAENGTFVVYRGEELIVNSLDKEIALELIKVGRTIENSYIILCGKNSAYIESRDERLIEQTEKYYARYEVVEDLNNQISSLNATINSLVEENSNLGVTITDLQLQLEMAKETHSKCDLSIDELNRKNNELLSQITILETQANINLDEVKTIVEELKGLINNA